MDTPMAIERVEITPATTPFQTRMATNKLIEGLKPPKKEGNKLSDEQLKEISGLDCAPSRAGVGGEGYSYLQTAIRHVLRHHDLVWKRIAGAGCITCLGPSEIVQEAHKARRHTHKHEKQISLKLGVAAAKADDTQRGDVMLQLALHGTLIQASSLSHSKKLAVRDYVEKPDPARLLAAMVKNDRQT